MDTSGQHMLIGGTIDLIAGSLGGVANVLVGQPLDTIKVKIQTFPNLYQNAVVCFRKTLLTDGIRRGLYAGTSPAIIANVAENSVLFCGYGFCQNMVTGLRGKSEASALDKAFAGFAAAFFSSFTLCPTELVKCKLQALREQNQTGKKISATKITVQIVKSEGVAGLFRGLTSTMAREMPGYFFFFGGYETSKILLTNGHPEKAGLLGTIVSGGVGGICLWSSIFPFDVVKSRIQVESSKEKMITVLLRIKRSEGIRGLYRGLSPTLLRTFPSTGALFVAYEYSREFMTAGARRLVPV